MDSARPHFVTRAPADAAGWVALFDAERLPVLASTAAEIELWRQHEDAADAHALGEAIAGDPLMTLALMARVAALRRARGAEADERGAPETVTAALVLLGIGPFFRSFGAQPSVDDWLAGQPRARAGFDAVLARARRGANFALAFAAHRMDPDAAVLHAAALLHEVAELLLWLRAPALASAIADRQAADSALRSADAQRELLGTTLAEIECALLRAWGLPPLLRRLSDERHAGEPQVRNIRLAVRLARHSARGWEDPALPDDRREIGELLQLADEPLQRLLRDIDREVSPPAA
ncbi:MAG: HDOD domain-containing protein [Burkholderiales bacterium]|nr:HDOD domain-containing protein [Burkholderiales bacterium]